MDTSKIFFKIFIINLVFCNCMFFRTFLLQYIQMDGKSKLSIILHRYKPMKIKICIMTFLSWLRKIWENGIFVCDWVGLEKGKRRRVSFGKRTSTIPQMVCTEYEMKHKYLSIRYLTLQTHTYFSTSKNVDRKKWVVHINSNTVVYLQLK